MAVGNGGLHSGRDVVRAVGGADISTVSSWEVKQMAAVLCAGQRVYPGSRAYCMASDAKRLGEPKIDNVVYEFFDTGAQQGSYLPPQDTSETNRI